MAVQEGLVYSEDEAVIMVGTIADEHEVPNHNHNHNHTLFLNSPDPALLSSRQMVSNVGCKSVFELEVC